MDENPSVVQSLLHWLPPVAGVLVMALCIALGMWQLSRADYKQDLQNKQDAALAAQPQSHATIADLQPGARVTLTGRWAAEHAVLLDNRSYRKQPGYHLLMPLMLANGEALIVNRGWLPARLDRRLPELRTPSGQVQITGLTRDPAESLGYSIGAVDASAPVWMQLDMDAWRSRMGNIPLAAVLLMQENAADDGLVRDWVRADFGVDTHHGYAFQWFALAATAAVLSLWWLRKQWMRSASGQHADDATHS